MEMHAEIQDNRYFDEAAYQQAGSSKVSQEVTRNGPSEDLMDTSLEPDDVQTTVVLANTANGGDGGFNIVRKNRDGFQFTVSLPPSQESSVASDPEPVVMDNLECVNGVVNDVNAGTGQLPAQLPTSTLESLGDTSTDTVVELPALFGNSRAMPSRNVSGARSAEQLPSVVVTDPPDMGHEITGAPQGTPLLAGSIPSHRISAPTPVSNTVSSSTSDPDALDGPNFGLADPYTYFNLKRIDRRSNVPPSPSRSKPYVRETKQSVGFPMNRLIDPSPGTVFDQPVNSKGFPRFFITSVGSVDKFTGRLVHFTQDKKSDGQSAYVQPQGSCDEDLNRDMEMVSSTNSAIDVQPTLNYVSNLEPAPSPPCNLQEGPNRLLPRVLGQPHTQVQQSKPVPPQPHPRLQAPANAPAPTPQHDAQSGSRLFASASLAPAALAPVAKAPEPPKGRLGVGGIPPLWMGQVPPEVLTEQIWSELFEACDVVLVQTLNPKSFESGPSCDKLLFNVTAPAVDLRRISDETLELRAYIYSYATNKIMEWKHLDNKPGENRGAGMLKNRASLLIGPSRYNIDLLQPRLRQPFAIITPDLKKAIRNNSRLNSTSVPIELDIRTDIDKLNYGAVALVWVKKKQLDELVVDTYKRVINGMEVSGESLRKAMSKLVATAELQRTLLHLAGISDAREEIKSGQADEMEEIASTSSTVKFVDPLSLTKLVHPFRIRGCSHPTAFDLRFYLELCMNADGTMTTIEEDTTVVDVDDDDDDDMGSVPPKTLPTAVPILQTSAQPSVHVGPTLASAAGSGQPRAKLLRGRGRGSVRGGPATQTLSLTPDNLRKLQDQYSKVSPISTEQRIIRWLQSIPVGDAVNGSPADPSKSHNDTGQEHQDQTGMRSSNNSLGNQGGEDGNAGIGVRKDADARKTAKSAQAGGKMVSPATGSRRVSEVDKGKDRGRLCCYLKVEVSGNTQMLPIHEFDVPKELAMSFCKANNILGSVDSLTEHIVTAINNYRKS
ncbi:hypothetical protein HDU93_003326 [Gonapodya sp. JEL0774]|nr:hypothetical protein HDU93_003326 [Gonapodya sp. JEL0774]